MMKDMMSGFELYQPADVDDAIQLIDRYGNRGWKLAGGYDSLDWFKNRGKGPEAVIDLEGLDALKGIRETTDGVEIGALTTLTEVERSPLLRDRYGLLADAARRVASPQIRNAGTLGGNLSQDTRCWYYRYGVDCYRAGGNTCYAAAPEAMNREHALFGASRCVAVTPSDTAPALVALDAEMVVRNARGERVIPAADFFMEPSVDIQRMTVLDPDDLLTAIRLPASWAGADFYFEKVADRKSWDFALVSVAAAFRTSGAQIDEASIVCGAVQCIPRRLHDVEVLISGRTRNEETAALAGAEAIRGAEPLDYNHFKIPLMENLVKRAVRG
ncbi:MAG: xanthine dehydrogenase family protein subunit M [Gemmatimonadetes bacterium]|jgi:xanthine dehydrogenase YagS FAD-binding subunit|nr:xanthine dehydrogenase family protein subunit M [Gemmatimonadota bacterium]MEE2846003.1 xanthine dehydrogenase family protein subunit M [Gemmatimonadota bacterium]HAC05799.1 xanthine dehydrogenase family protein subunit M [Gemmatimonadota bacterium]HIN52412.1 xanthine dehydrogenase family protein subunit M [Gemmatimonadota bacterium]|tara:strand:+ start:7802 stop:8788 length:987 start_codon:yes stop_codon:yes gene_type:complete